MNKTKKAKQLAVMTELRESTHTLDGEVASLYVAGVDMKRVNAVAEAMNDAVPEDAKTVEVIYGLSLLLANALAKAEGMSPQFKVKIAAGLGDAMGEMIATWVLSEVVKEPEEEVADAPDRDPPPERRNGASKPVKSAPPRRAAGPPPYTERVKDGDHDVYGVDEFNGLNQSELPAGRAHAAIMERQGHYFMEPSSFDLENIGELGPEVTHIVWVQS